MKRKVRAILCYGAARTVYLELKRANVHARFPLAEAIGFTFTRLSIPCARQPPTMVTTHSIVLVRMGGARLSFTPSNDVYDIHRCAQQATTARCELAGGNKFSARPKEVVCSAEPQYREYAASVVGTMEAS